jgi:hypothetical protein
VVPEGFGPSLFLGNSGLSRARIPRFRQGTIYQCAQRDLDPHFVVFKTTASAKLGYARNAVSSEGFEPSRPFEHKLLGLACLPNSTTTTKQCLWRESNPHCLSTLVLSQLAMPFAYTSSKSLQRRRTLDYEFVRTPS